MDARRLRPLRMRCTSNLQRVAIVLTSLQLRRLRRLIHQRPHLLRPHRRLPRQGRARVEPASLVEARHHGYLQPRRN